MNSAPPQSLSFAEKIRFEKNDTILTYFGASASGEAFFCYIRCNRAGHQKMYHDFAENIARHPDEYGEVIYRDTRAEPDEKARLFLQKWLAEQGGKATTT